MEAATSRFPLRRVLAPAAAPRVFEDSTLVERARDGDSDAFEAIYSRYHAEILWFCRRRLRSREDAEDAAQNTFATAYRELLAARDRIELRPWLYGIARHRCLMTLRSRRAETDPLDDDLPVSEDTSDAVVRRQDLRELFVDLGELPDRQRSALLLAEVGGLSHAQIASRLECQPNQVKALVFQARTKLTDNRTARSVACAEIRQELASARGAALLRGHLRRHISSCPGCKQYESAVMRERSAVAFALSLFPGLGPGMMAAAGGAARLRLAQLLANLPFGTSLSGGGWRWAAAVTAAAATTGGGIAAVELPGPSGGAAAGAPRAAVASLIAPPGGASGVPRLTAAPSWAAPSAHRPAVSLGGLGRSGRARAVAHRYQRRHIASATQTLTAMNGQLPASGTPIASAAGPGAPGSSSGLGSHAVARPSGSAGTSAHRGDGPATAGGGSDHPNPGRGAHGPGSRGDGPHGGAHRGRSGGSAQAQAGPSSPSHGDGGGSPGPGAGDGHGRSPGHGKP